ncbi:enoyl-CoA delta isomerase 2 [Sergentomyia squamirostris]
MSLIVIENRGKLRIIRLNNAKRRNALSPEGYLDLTKALQDADKDDSVSVVAITGTGNFYSSGNDIKAAMMSSATDEERGKVLGDLIRSFYTCRKILIGVVNGPAIGIAATTLALCDIIYAEENAYFYTPFSALGLCAEGCSSYTFPKILGRSKASEMLLLNYKLTAQEALRFNFVSSIFTIDKIDSEVWAKIDEFARLPQQSLMITKSLMQKFDIDQLDAVNNAELEALKERFTSEDCMNAVMEFLQKKERSSL